MKSTEINIPAFGFSIVGLTFSLLSAFRMTDALCVTQGCSVYEGFSVFGLSLYWFGAAAFLILLSLTVIWRGEYLTAAAALFLMFDMVFLVIQILLWSCVQCLFVAALFGVIMFSAMIRKKSIWIQRTLGLWFLLFFVNGVGVVKEIMVPWPVYGKDTAPVHLYFSPTCPSCQEMIDTILARPEGLSQIALYPISKNQEDTQRIILLVNMLKSGTPIKEAMVKYKQAKSGDIKQDGIYLQTLVNTSKNMMALSRMNITHVPFLTARTSFWSDIKKADPPKDDCLVFSTNAPGKCEDNTKPGGLQELFKSR